MKLYKVILMLVLLVLSVQTRAEYLGIKVGDIAHYDTRSTNDTDTYWSPYGYDFSYKKIKVTLSNVYITNQYANSPTIWVDLKVTSSTGRRWSYVECFEGTPGLEVTCDINLDSVPEYNALGARVDLKINYVGLDFNYDIQIDMESSSQPKAIGDVLARDLDTEVAGALGHVGLWTGNEVLEVSNVSSVVRKISLNQFKSTKYWGARYGKGTRAQAIKAINAGWEQRKYNPKYTLFAGATTEGGLTKQKQIPIFGWRKFFWFRIPILIGWETVDYQTEAVFRCDTFVKFSCAKAGVSLGNS